MNADKDKLKVLMTTDTVGGVWTYCMELCSALKNINFHLVTTGAALYDWQQNEVKKLTNVTLYESAYKLEWQPDCWEDIDISSHWLLELDEKIHPDIIHLNSYSYGSVKFSAPVIVVAHSDVFSWWQAVKKEDPPVEWQEYYERVRNGLQGAERIVAPSHAMKNRIQQIYNVQEQIDVIYNGRNCDQFYSREKQPYIFTMGRIWDEAKNIDLLVRAAKDLKYKIYIAGKAGKEKPKANSRIEILGQLSKEDIAKYLSAASVFVLPARYEPFGLSALEAGLSGCALVLGDISSLREIWNDNAVFVNTDDPEMLVGTIHSLMRDTSELHKYAAKAYEHAKTYTVQKMASGYSTLYSQLKQEKQEKAYTL